jgi:hypothetical protein
MAAAIRSSPVLNAPADIFQVFPHSTSRLRVTFCRSHFATIKQMESKMIKLGRVSKQTRGAVLPQMIEDLILRNDGSNYPKT